MYGYSGYGTNAYGSERQSIVAPLIKLAARIVQNGYAIGYTLLLRFRPLTLNNPETNSNILEL
jgi:hypothetical protein